MPTCAVCKKSHEGTLVCCDSCRRNSNKWKARNRLQNLCINHRNGDRRKNRYNKEEHVTAKFLKEQLETQQSKCHHCYIPMNINVGRVDNGMWLQRLDNNLGHTIHNTVLACRACNVRRVETGQCSDWLELRKGQVQFNEVLADGYQHLQKRSPCIR